MSLKPKIGFFDETEGVRSMMILSSFILLAYFIISNAGVFIPIVFMDHSYSLAFYIYNFMNNVFILGYIFIPKLLQKKIENGDPNS